MKNSLRKLLSFLLILALFSQFFINLVDADKNPNWYSIFKTVDKNSFNEYRYLITKEFFKIKHKWDVDWVIEKSYLNKLRNLSAKSYNYLPDNNLENENLLNNLNTAISKALKYESSDVSYLWLIQAVWAYLDESSIWAITWDVYWAPKDWNAPFNVTLRASVSDPTWTKIPKYNYVWWMDYGSRKVNIWTWPSINYTFKEEGIFTVFVDIRSAHKNSKWYTDVIPYRWEVKIKVKEKVASVIIKVNSDRLGYRERLKFTPSQAKYWLLFDATSSTPTGSAKFTRTEWNFGNWTKRSYSWEPKIERIKYLKEWDFDVKLKLKTNLWKTIEKEFVISIHDPIATIDVSPKEWFLWDKFTFRAKNTSSDDNLTYNWQIVDIVNDKVVFSEQTKLFTYNFKNKWHFNVKLEVNGVDSGSRNIDTKNIYINSRAPVADFSYSIPETNKPNKVLLDATDSFDPDFVDTGKLKYSWEIDGSRVDLDEANENGSLWFYTFSSVWDHSVVLRVEDPDNIEWTKKDKVKISSILSLDFSANPRAIKRWNSIAFDAISPEAQFFEWDFGDGNKSSWWVEEKIKHKYEKTGIFNVKLKVIDKVGKSNTHSKVVYVWNWEKPVSILNVFNNINNTVIEKNACKGQSAYIADRITPLNFDAGQSIDIDWNNNNLDYSLKIWASKYFTSRNTTYKFDEIWCFPVILKVTSKTNRSSDTKKIWVKVKNLDPYLSTLVAKTDSLDTEPVVVSVDAIGASDKDWVITSYLWYYYTDLDPEPQDFRSTVWPSTKFVLPKITWNYYFVVLLTDDSDSRVSSKELWKLSSLTLAWNNINVPILDLRTPDNSVHVWDQVILNAKVQNILKQNISKKVQYFWDFDWDGFYDLETKKSSITHIYDKPWTFYAKLKVKHRWFSNTRNIEINVANSLVPKFDYFSVWNKFIFLNKTTWSYENFSFDLGDGTKIENRDYFEHTYKDGKSSHSVVLNVSDWNKAKKIEKKVVKNINNLFDSKKSKDGIILLSPAGDKDGSIIIEKRISSVSVVVFQNLKNFSEISADIDLDKDSDLNGWKDDDIDITNIKDNYLEIQLDNNKTQNIRVFVKDSDANLILSKNYKVIKNYIKDEDIDLNKISFKWVTEKEKEKLKDLKNLVSSIVWDDWKIAKTYISRLKDEWNDNNERTKIIYEFEWFLASSLIENKNEIIENLEELLLKENDDNSLKSIALRALQWLTPIDVECDFDSKEYKSCKEYIDFSLEAIRTNDDVTQNKVLGKSILQIIWKDKTLSTPEKLSYKSTLQNLIYWDVSSIPNQELNEDENDESSKESWITSVLKWIFYIVFGVLVLFLLWALLYFIYYKISNKKTDKGFKDFVEEKTSIKDDIFSEKLEVDKEEKPTQLTEKIPESKKELKSDIFSPDNDSIDSTQTKTNIFEAKKANQEPKLENPWVAPGWLKWTNELSLWENNLKQENSINKSWNSEIKEEKNEKIKEVDKLSDTKDNDSLDDVTRVEDDIPDWLKGSLDDKPKDWPTKRQDSKNLNSISLSDSKSEKIDWVNAEPKNDIPDWLKWGLPDEEDTKKPNEVLKDSKKLDDEKEVSKKIVKNQDKKLEKDESKENKVDIKAESTTKKATPKKLEAKDLDGKKDLTKKQEEKNLSDSVETKKQSSKKEDKAKKQDSIRKDDKKQAKKQADSKKSVKEKIDKKNSQDLWDDWMDVPDWLKS